MPKIKVIVQFSGGKDSLASLLWTIKDSGFKSVEAVFCDTGWEHEITINHINDVCTNLAIPLKTLFTKKYYGMSDMADQRKRFPSAKARFCTEELKTKPFIDYILDKCKCNVIIIQGIRKDESKARSLMRGQCTYFRYYYEPYQSNSMIIANLSTKINPTEKEVLNLDKAKKRLSEGKEDNKFHTYRKKEVLEFRKKYLDDVIRPCFDWTGVQVMQYILEKGYRPNELYYNGAKRVGCFPCVMCSKSEVKMIMDNYPEHIDKIRKAEQNTGYGFFAPDYIPKRYRTGIGKTGKTFPYIDDVVKYIKDKNATLDMFKDDKDNEKGRCMSFYGICE